MRRCREEGERQGAPKHAKTSTLSKAERHQMNNALPTSALAIDMLHEILD